VVVVDDSLPNTRDRPGRARCDRFARPGRAALSWRHRSRVARQWPTCAPKLTRVIILAFPPPVLAGGGVSLFLGQLTDADVLGLLAWSVPG
jgi:hypothetical protein